MTLSPAVLESSETLLPSPELVKAGVPQAGLSCAGLAGFGVVLAQAS